MKITYQFDTAPNGEDWDDFEFEIDDYRKVNKILTECIKTDYPELSQDDIEMVLDDYDKRDDLVEEYYEFIKEQFEAQAREEYEDQKSYEKDPYAYYGVSRKDFE